MGDNVKLAKLLIVTRFDLNIEEAAHMLERMAENQHVRVENVAAELVAEERKKRASRSP